MSKVFLYTFVNTIANSKILKSKVLETLTNRRENIIQMYLLHRYYIYIRELTKK